MLDEIRERKNRKKYSKRSRRYKGNYIRSMKRILFDENLFDPFDPSLLSSPAPLRVIKMIAKNLIINASRLNVFVSVKTTKF